MTVEDLLDWIDRRFLCGSLSVERGETVRTFQFDSGYVTGESSNEAEEHLGRMLVARGLVDEAALQDAFDVQADTGVLLGKILLMVGAIDEASLRAALEEKIREALFDAMTWGEGTFLFERVGELPRVSEYEISVNLRAALEEGQRRADEWREIREILPSDDVVLAIADPDRLHRPGDSAEVRADIDRIAACLGQAATVNQVVLAHGGARFAVVSRLAGLVDRGALAVQHPRKSRAETADGLSPAELTSAARSRAAGGDRGSALDLARKALAAAPEDASVQKLHRELERALFAELSRDLLTSFRVPKLLKSMDELDHLDLSDAERYLAGRIDGRWDLLSLMRVSPLREVEALITFKRLADRGIISL